MAARVALNQVALIMIEVILKVVWLTL
ncbi:hypothetical protein [Sporomusa acidovorans]